MSTEIYGSRVKSLATFEFLGETFRVCRPRHNGKVWASVKWLVIVHGSHWVANVSSPYQTVTPEMAVGDFLRRAKAIERIHGTSAREHMLGQLAKMKPKDWPA